MAMAVVETWLRCELMEPVQVHYLKGNVFSQDSEGNLIGVEVFRNGEPATLGGSVTGYCILADGSTIPVSGQRVENRVSIKLLQACYAIPGAISIVVKNTDGNTITTLGCIVATVYRSKTDNMVTPSSTVIEDWAQQISETLQQCLDATYGTVKYSEAQSLTDEQKAQARANIGASGGESGDYVSYGESQSLTTAEKQTARTNIGAAASGDVPTDYVSYGVAQSLTDAQKERARGNIDSNIDVGLYVGNDGYIYQKYTT